MPCCRRRADSKSSPADPVVTSPVEAEADIDLEIGVEGTPVPPLATKLWLPGRHTAERAAAELAHNYPPDLDFKLSEKGGADFGDIHEVLSRCQLMKAYRMLGSSPGALPEDQKAELHGRVERLQRVLRTCSPPTDAEAQGWKRFDLENVVLWRCWDSKSGELKVILSWECKGSLMHNLCSLRDADVAEPFWDGASWEMKAEHAGGATLTRWLQKDIFSGKKQEIILERILCDCLDEDRPCWLVTERSPMVENLQDFAGVYGPFDIPAAPKGYSRAVMPECGRIVEPTGPNSTRVSCALSAKLPVAVKWLVTDSLLSFAVKLSSKNTQKSWDRLIDQWDDSGYPERIQRDAEFYEPVAVRIRQHLARVVDTGT